MFQPVSKAIGLFEENAHGEEVDGRRFFGREDDKDRAPLECDAKPVID